MVDILRRVAARPLFARVLRAPRVERVVATVLRSVTVDARVRFVARELFGRRRLHVYRIAGTGRSVFIRHGTPDIVTLDEVFLRRDYEFPDAVDELVRSLGRDPIALDLGANIGLFGVFFLGRFPRGRVIAIEADGANAVVLQRCAGANGGYAHWDIVEAVAATAAGTTRFASGGYSLSRLDDAGEEIPAVDTFPYLDRVDIAKIDIEGGEWAILGDLRLRDAAVRAVVLEYHPYLCPERDPRDAAEAGLRRAGFVTKLLHHYEHGHGMIWGWRDPAAVAWEDRGQF